MLDYYINLLEWDQKKSYTLNEFIIKDNGLYRANKNISPNTPWNDADWIIIISGAASFLLIDCFNSLNTTVPSLEFQSCVLNNNNEYEFYKNIGNVWTKQNISFENILLIIKEQVFKGSSYNNIQTIYFALFDLDGKLLYLLNLVEKDGLKLIQIDNSDLDIFDNTVIIPYVDTFKEQDGILKSLKDEINIKAINGEIEFTGVSNSTYYFDYIIDNINDIPYIDYGNATLLDLSTGKTYTSVFKSDFLVTTNELRVHWNRYKDIDVTGPKRCIKKVLANPNIPIPEIPVNMKVARDDNYGENSVPKLFMQEGSGIPYDCDNLTNTDSEFWFMYNEFIGGYPNKMGLFYSELTEEEHGPMWSCTNSNCLSNLQLDDEVHEIFYDGFVDFGDLSGIPRQVIGFEFLFEGIDNNEDNRFQFLIQYENGSNTVGNGVYVKDIAANYTYTIIDSTGNKEDRTGDIWSWVKDTGILTFHKTAKLTKFLTVNNSSPETNNFTRNQGNFSLINPPTNRGIWNTTEFTIERATYPLCFRDIKDTLYNDSQMSLTWQAFYNSCFSFEIEGFFFIEDLNPISISPYTLIYGGNNVIATKDNNNRFHGVYNYDGNNEIVIEHYTGSGLVPLNLGEITAINANGPPFNFNKYTDILIKGTITRDDGQVLHVHEKNPYVNLPEFGLHFELFDDNGVPKINFTHSFMDTLMMEQKGEDYVKSLRGNHDLTIPIIDAGYRKAQFDSWPAVYHSIYGGTGVPSAFNVGVYSVPYGFPYIRALNEGWVDKDGKIHNNEVTGTIDSITFHEVIKDKEKNYHLKRHRSDSRLPRQELFEKHGIVCKVIDDDDHLESDKHYVISVEVEDGFTKNSEIFYTTKTYIHWVHDVERLNANLDEFDNFPLKTEDPNTGQYDVSAHIITLDPNIFEAAFYFSYRMGNHNYKFTPKNGTVSIMISGGDLETPIRERLNVHDTLKFFYFVTNLPKSATHYIFWIFFDGYDAYKACKFSTVFYTEKITIALEVPSVLFVKKPDTSIKLPIFAYNTCNQHSVKGTPVQISYWKAFSKNEPTVINTTLGLEDNTFITNVDIPVNYKDLYYIVDVWIQDSDDNYESRHTTVLLLVDENFTPVDGHLGKQTSKFSLIWLGRGGPTIGGSNPKYPLVGIKSHFDWCPNVYDPSCQCPFPFDGDKDENYFASTDDKRTTVLMDSKTQQPIANWLAAFYDPTDIHKQNFPEIRVVTPKVALSPPGSAINLNMYWAQAEWVKGETPAEDELNYYDIYPWARKMGSKPLKITEMKDKEFVATTSITAIDLENKIIHKTKGIYFTDTTVHLTVPVFNSKITHIFIETTGDVRFAPKMFYLPVLSDGDHWATLTVDNTELICIEGENNVKHYNISLNKWDRTPITNAEVTMQVSFLNKNKDDKYTTKNQKATTDNDGRIEFVLDIDNWFPTIKDDINKKIHTLLLSFYWEGHVQDDDGNLYDDYIMPAVFALPGIYEFDKHKSETIITRIVGMPASLQFSPTELCSGDFTYSFVAQLQWLNSEDNKWYPLPNKDMLKVYESYNFGTMGPDGIGKAFNIKSNAYGNYIYELTEQNEWKKNPDIEMLRNKMDTGFLMLGYSGDDTYRPCFGTTMIQGCKNHYSSDNNCQGFYSKIFEDIWSYIVSIGGLVLQGYMASPSAFQGPAIDGDELADGRIQFEMTERELRPVNDADIYNAVPESGTLSIYGMRWMEDNPDYEPAQLKIDRALTRQTGSYMPEEQAGYDWDEFDQRGAYNPALIFRTSNPQVQIIQLDDVQLETTVGVARAPDRVPRPSTYFPRGPWEWAPDPSQPIVEPINQRINRIAVFTFRRFYFGDEEYWGPGFAGEITWDTNDMSLEEGLARQAQFLEDLQVQWGLEQMEHPDVQVEWETARDTDGRALVEIQRRFREISNNSFILRNISREDQWRFRDQLRWRFWSARLDQIVNDDHQYVFNLVSPMSTFIRDLWYYLQDGEAFNLSFAGTPYNHGLWSEDIRTWYVSNYIYR